MSGFTFGATPAPPTAPTATAAAPNSGAFSFGAPAAAAAPPPPPATALSFGAAPPAASTGPPPTPANPTAATATNPAVSNVGLFLSTPASATATPQQSHATIPAYETAFPNVTTHTQIERLLHSIVNPQNHTLEHRTELIVTGQELVHLLAPTTTPNSGGGASVGTALSHPEPLTFTTPNTTLRHAIHPPVVPKSTTEAPPAYLTFPTNSKPTPVPAPLISQILQLSDTLRLQEEEAAALYAEVASSSTTGGGGGGGLDAGRIRCHTVRMFHKRQRLGVGGGGGGSSSCQFCEEAVGVAQRHGTYVTSADCGESSARNPSSESSGMGRGGDGGEPVLRTARELFFWERGYCLQTLLLLIQHRVSACTNLSSSFNKDNNNINNDDAEDDGDDVNHSNKTNEIEDGKNLSARIILEATDQLLQQGLITNLLNLITKLTKMNEGLGKKICAALDKVDAQQRDLNGGTGAVPAVAAFGGTTATAGLFGGSAMTPVPAAGGAAAGVAAISIDDMDYALYEFTSQQRQMAVECIFYLTYHTQCTQGEIAALIDLIQDLTNGNSNSNNSSTGTGGGDLGSGLPELEPVKDVGVWMEGLEGRSHHAQQQQEHGVMGGMFAASSGLHIQQQQQQQQPEQQGRKHYEWKNDLVTSLWSVRGLRLNAARQNKEYNPNANRWDGFSAAGGTVGTVNGDGSGENVGGGKPQLLRCVTTLILSVVCSLDGKNILVDRDLHGPNAFGVGNALIPSPDADISTYHSNINAITERLDPKSGKIFNWKRQDIAGVLSAAFALLLRPAASAIPSPRHQQQHQRSNTYDIKSTFRNCLEIPTITKSLSFARLAMIPCIGMSSMNPASSDLDSNFSFYMSVISGFTTQYLDAICIGDLPTSRAKWTLDEEKELQMRHVQEGQKQQMAAWSGDGYTEVAIPTEVDVSKRPDCLDDIIALAVAMCSVCPDCTIRFWSVEDGDEGGASSGVVQLKPSRIIKNLERELPSDPSLIPAYLSFLSALALSEAPDDPTLSRNGATAVHDWVSNIDGSGFSPTSPGHASSTSVTRDRIDWAYILTTIRWYAHQISPPGGSSVDGFGQSTSSYTPTEDSSQYYYGAENNDNTNSNSKGGDAKSSSASTTEKNKELDETSTLTLLSLISLLSHVALKSDLARWSILSLVIPGSSRYAPEDDVLSILFSLLITSITPEIRGSILTAIANLVRCDDNRCLSEDQVEQVMNVARRCWDNLEQCQIIPIDALSQYSKVVDSSNMIAGSFAQSVSSRKFPKADTTRDSCWFPASDKYGIVNQMEHVESKKGRYPFTEGLLRLLTALISTVGCPSDLGSAWRPRPGCTPYIEFVVNFVLPRVMGTKGGGASLYFATLADKARLTTRALEVIDAVVTSYAIPSQNEVVAPKTNLRNTTFLPGQKSNLTQKQSVPQIQPSLRELASKSALALVRSDIFPSSEVQQDISEALMDFTNDNVQARPSTQMQTNEALLTSNNGISSNMSSPVMSEKAPRAKSPGFSVLADLLSSGGSLFDILAQILVDEEGPNGINTLYGGTIYAKSVALALFGDAPPDFSPTNSGRDFVSEQQQRYTTSYQTPAIPSTKVTPMMLVLSPPTVQDFADKPMKNSKRFIASSDDAIFWREHSILLVLRILCATAGREDKFSHRLSLSPASVRLVPVLRFQPRAQHGAMMPLDVKSIQVAHLTNQLLGHSRLSVSGRDENLIRVLVQYVGYQSASFADEEDIAAMAVSLIAYLCATASPSHYVQALSGLNTYGQAQLAAALSTRLSMHSKEKNSVEGSIKGVILDLILKNLNIESVGDDNLSHIILGLSGQSLEAHKNWLQQPSPQQVLVEYGEYRNALDVVLELISDTNFVLDPITSVLAAKCYEIIFRLCDAHDNVETTISPAWLCKTSVIVKLRSMGFWHTQLLRLLDSSYVSESVLRTITSKSPLTSEGEHADFITVFRNSNVLHCISWLLKGAAVELHALMGFNCPVSQNPSLGGILASSAPQPSQCRRLLKLLLDGPNSVILQTLLDLPLMKPSMIADGLGVDSPPRELLQAASKTLEGPVDICGGYHVIDPVRLLTTMGISTATRNEISEQNEGVMIKWAQKWNSYVTFTCAASHLSNAWSILLRTLITICEPLIFVDESRTHFDDEQVVDRSSIIWLLKSSLLRLGTDHHAGERGHNNTDLVLYSNFEQQDVGKKNEIDPSTALPLSVVCFSLVQWIFGCENHMNFSVDMDDLVEIISLLIDALVCCDALKSGEEDCHDERAAVLSCTLTIILDFTTTTDEMQLPSHMLLTFQSQALRAGIYLSKLSATCNQQSNAAEDKNSITRVARSGLASLISFFDVQNDNTEKSNHFLLELFASGIKEGNSYLSQFIRLLTEFDCGIVMLLERIACCYHGTELLVNAGITAGLISASTTSSQNIGSTFNNDTYGSIEVEPPRFLGGHLSLLNSLLASISPSHIRQQILRDAVQFIENNAALGERLLKTYPRYDNLTTQFITSVYLISCGSTGVEERNVEDINQRTNLTSIFNKEAISGLQQRIMNLAFHIGQYPFPCQHLAQFPNALRDAQNTRINCLKNVDVHRRTEKCWWDSIIFDDEHVITLPDPPFGSSDANFLKNSSLSMNNQKSNSMWSDQKYHIAMSGVQCLDLCLLFLSSRTNASKDPINYDGLALAQILCRISDTINATNIRLKKLLSSEETELPVMMDLTNINTGDGRVARGREVIAIEKNALLGLGPHMANCVEKLLCLALTQARVFAKEAQSGTFDNGKKSVVYEFSSVLLSALTHTRLESQGICGVNVDAIINKTVQQTAKDLRINLENISRLK